MDEIITIENLSFSYPDGIALTNTPFMWNPSDDKFYFKKDSRVFEKVGLRYGLTREEIQKEFERRVKLLYELFKRKIFNSDNFVHWLHAYRTRLTQMPDTNNIKPKTMPKIKSVVLKLSFRSVFVWPSYPLASMVE